jgi:hypothetical protein
MLAREFVIATRYMDESLTLYQVDHAIGNPESRGLLIQGAMTGCSILSNDVYVRALVDDARTFEDRRRRHRADMRAIMGDRTHFENFLRLEKLLLLQAGMDQGLADVIIRRCRDAREGARRGRFDARAFGYALEELRLVVCGVLADMRKATLDQDRQEQMFRRLAAIRVGVFGSVVVGLDGSSLIATVGLSAAGAAVSIAIGGAMVGQAINELSATGQHRRSWLTRWFRRSAGSRFHVPKQLPSGVEERGLSDLDGINGCCDTVARAVRGARGMVATLPPLRVITRVRWPRSRPKCSMSAPVASDTRSPLSASSPGPGQGRRRCCQVWAASGNLCRRSTSNPRSA